MRWKRFRILEISGEEGWIEEESLERLKHRRVSPTVVGTGACWFGFGPDDELMLLHAKVQMIDMDADLSRLEHVV